MSQDTENTPALIWAGVFSVAGRVACRWPDQTSAGSGRHDRLPHRHQAK
jgi:hypothetical protein